MPKPDTASILRPEFAATLMESLDVSPTHGFLRLNTPRWLPLTGENRMRRYFFALLDHKGYELPLLIAQQKVARAISELPVPRWSFDDLPLSTMYRLQLLAGMLAHAYFQEKLAAPRAVTTLYQNTHFKALPSQLAIVLWACSKRTGIAPCLSYTLYSLANWHQPNISAPLSLDNLAPIHTFTASDDEQWFINIHQMIEATFAPAIPALITAHFLAAAPHNDGLLGDALERTAEVMREVNGVLERMRERCNYATYFQRIRMFYAYPRNVLYSGVPELHRRPLNLFGETGGQAPFKHFLLAMIGGYPKEESYFPKMQAYMGTSHRDVIAFANASKIRWRVLREGTKNRNQRLRDQYNAVIETEVEWGRIHLGLARDFIHAFGDRHGTGSTPIDWLAQRYAEREKLRII